MNASDTYRIETKAQVKREVKMLRILKALIVGKPSQYPSKPTTTVHDRTVAQWSGKVTFEADPMHGQLVLNSLTFNVC